VRAASGPLGQPGHLEFVNSQSEQLQIVIKLDNIPTIKQSQALTESERKSKQEKIYEA
jgi:hypothetical protein